MRIRTTYNIGNKVVFWSVDMDEELEGEIDEIHIEVTDSGMEVMYRIEATKIYKQSRLHFVEPSDIIKKIKKFN